MASRQLQTIQPKQGGFGTLTCIAVAMHKWTPSFNISLERGNYDPASIGFLDEKKVI